MCLSVNLNICFPCIKVLLYIVTAVVISTLRANYPAMNPGSDREHLSRLDIVAGNPRKYRRMTRSKRSVNVRPRLAKRCATPSD